MRAKQFLRLWFIFLSVSPPQTGQPELRAMAVLEIFVLDENDNAPVFDRDSYEASIAEDAEPMSRLLIVSATDADTGESASGRQAALIQQFGAVVLLFS